MFKCDNCDRELKSKAGLAKHMTACERKSAVDVIKDELADREEVESPEPEVNVDDILMETIMVCDGQDSSGAVIKLEVCGGAADYYEGHPRRIMKLKGLLNRTFDKRERGKIIGRIAEAEYADN